MGLLWRLEPGATSVTPEFGFGQIVEIKRALYKTRAHDFPILLSLHHNRDAIRPAEFSSRDQKSFCKASCETISWICAPKSCTTTDNDLACVRSGIKASSFTIQFLKPSRPVRMS